MISQRYAINMKSSSESLNSMSEMPSRSPVGDNSMEVSFSRSYNFPVRCYHSMMPPPPHNMLNTLNNNNNNTKNYNKNNSWNNQKKNKNDRQVTQLCDKEANNKSNNYSKKSENSRNVKYIYGRNVGTQNSTQYHLYNPCEPIQRFNPDTFFPFMSPQHHHNGFFHKKFYTHRQDRTNRNKRNITFSPESNSPLVDMLMTKFLGRAKFVEIKENPQELENGGEWDALSRQVWTTFQQFQQTEETYNKKIYLWQYLYTFIRKVFPRYGLFLVGSTMSGFGSNTSDVDICLLVRPSYVDQRSEALHYLEQIKYALKQCDFIDHAEVIWAKVPILKFHDASRGLDVDLNCNNSVGIRNTHLLHCYSNLDWRVRPLVLIVKMWARANNINDAKNMTISSYSLALMVIHYLQCGVTPPVIPCLHGLYPTKFLPESDIHHIDMHELLVPFCSDNKQSLGELLVGFLHYYATFNYAEHAISVRLGAAIPVDECRMARSHKNDPHQWKHLCIEEPFDLTNTARSVYDPQIFERIKAVIVHSYHRLQEARDLAAIFNLNDTEKL